MLLTRKTTGLAIVGACALLLLAPNARAGSVNFLLDATSNTNTPPDYGASTWNLGFQFNVTSSITVYGLANFYDGVPFPQDQQVGLWDSNGNLLASTYVSSTDPIQGFWQYSFLSVPVVLSAGSYVVGGEGGADYSGVWNTVTMAPGTSYTTDLYTYNGGANTPLVEPTATEGVPYGWFGGNAVVSPSATPEPQSFLLLGAPLVGLGILRRTRSKSAK